jgi:antitoxin YefM
MANLSPAKLSAFFQQSPLAEVTANGELDLNRPFEITEQDASAFVVVSAEDWEQQQETLFVLQNSHLLEQISHSMATHEQHQGYQPSQEELDEILSV